MTHFKTTLSIILIISVIGAFTFIYLDLRMKQQSELIKGCKDAQGTLLIHDNEVSCLQKQTCLLDEPVEEPAK